MVKDAKYQDLREELKPTAYLSLSQDPRPGTFAQLLIRSSVPPASVIPSLKQAFKRAGPAIVPTFQDYQGMVNDLLMRDELVAMLSTFFGLLAILGLYGVIAFAVARRTNEIGIRMALGADPEAILKMILGEAFTLVAIGLVVGTALALAQTVQTPVSGLEPNDPVTLILASLLLAVVGLAASLVPAHRASRVAPMAALLVLRLPKVTNRREFALRPRGLAVWCSLIFSARFPPRPASFPTP